MEAGAWDTEPAKGAAHRQDGPGRSDDEELPFGLRGLVEFGGQGFRGETVVLQRQAGCAPVPLDETPGGPRSVGRRLHRR